jgi:cytochrome c oxidase cbb3-type subunit III
MCAKKVTKAERDVGTTGHVWDGIEELNNPLPRWWVWVLYLTIVWALAYTVMYPAWPMISHATQGLWGGNPRSAVEVEIAKWDAANAEIKAKLVAADINAIPADPALSDFAVKAGKAVFNTYCVQCHMREGQGNSVKGYPTLSDNDWLFGGSMEAIALTVTHGVRNATDPDARNVGLVMPAWETDAAPVKLTGEEIGQVVEYVLQISGQEHDAAAATAGAQLFTDNCVACHGEKAEGNRDMGSPTLTDAIWMYGGSREALTQTIAKGRGGVMPAWTGRLSEDQIRAVATYVHALGGGE